MVELSRQAAKQEIGFVLINSNEALRADRESIESMKVHAKRLNFAFKYLVDTDSKLADSFGATRTPQVFLFDQKSLVYKGGITDNERTPSESKSNYLKDAMNSLQAGTTIKISSSKSIGCGIQRK